MIKAFGIGVIFALLATGVIICISLIVAYHENHQAAKPDEQGSIWRSTLTFVVLLSLSGVFLVLVRMALRWLID